MDNRERLGEQGMLFCVWTLLGFEGQSYYLFLQERSHSYFVQKFKMSHVSPVLPYKQKAYEEEKLHLVLLVLL